MTPGAGVELNPGPAYGASAWPGHTCPAGLEQALWAPDPHLLQPSVPCRSMACYGRGQCYWPTTSSSQEHRISWHTCEEAAALSAHTSPPTWSMHMLSMAWRRLSTWAQAAQSSLDGLPCSRSVLNAVHLRSARPRPSHTDPSARSSRLSHTESIPRALAQGA